VMGPFAVIALDGVLADMDRYKRGRQSQALNWRHRFPHDFIEDAAPNAALVGLAQALKMAGRIAVLSERPDTLESLTAKWLRQNGIQYDKLVMRQAVTLQGEARFKADAIIAMHQEGNAPWLVIDNDPRVAGVCRHLCIECIVSSKLDTN